MWCFLVFLEMLNGNFYDRFLISIIKCLLYVKGFVGYSGNYGGVLWFSFFGEFGVRNAGGVMKGFLVILGSKC